MQLQLRTCLQLGKFFFNFFLFYLIIFLFNRDLSETNNSSSVVVKSVITSITQGGTNGEAETLTTATTSRKESKF